MIFFSKIKNSIQNFKKFIKNYKFKQELKQEKSKKYLFFWKKNDESYFEFYKNARKFTNIITFNKEDFKKYTYYYVIIWFVLIILCIYIVFFSPYFRISSSKTIIERLDTITDINIAYKSVEDFYWQSIFLINKSKIEDSIIKMQKNIWEVKITRLFPNWLKIILKSYDPLFNANIKKINKTYILTSNWILISSNNIEKNLLNIDIIDSSLEEFEFLNYKEWIDELNMAKINTIIKIFKENFSNKNITKLAYFKIEREIHIFLESGTIIILTLNEDINKQFAFLKLYNDNYKDILNTWELLYIDIRILWKIFTCMEKNICKQNLNRIYNNYYLNK